MRVALVTGGAGFVGRCLVSLLRERGVRAVDFGPDAAGFEDGPPDHGDTIVGSVSDRAAVENAVTAVKPDIVFHLAAFGVGGDGLIRSAVKAPLDSVRVNVLGSSVVCHVAVEQKVSRFVWSSSTSVFPSVPLSEQRPADEDVEPRPDTVYGATKRSAELLIGQLSRGTGTRCTGLRLPSVYGAGRYPGALASFTRFVADVAHFRDTAIDATTYPVDWLHVHDAAAALMLAGEKALPRPIYNVVGHRSSLAEMAAAVSSHATARAEVSIAVSPDLVPDLMDGGRFTAEAQFTPRFGLTSGAEEYVSAERRSH